MIFVKNARFITTMFIPIVFISMPLAGFILLWIMHLIYAGRQTADVQPLQMLLVILAWGLILIGFALPLGLSVIGLVPAMATGVIFAMTLVQYRLNERRSLLWMLALCAERGLPLQVAARSFAAERSDAVGRRALRLAELLEAGVPLPDAFRQSGSRLPADAEIATRLAYETGGLNASLIEVAHAGASRDRHWRPLFEKCAYFAMLFYMTVGMWTFVMIKIVPAMIKICEDFEAELPPATILLITLSKALVQNSLALSLLIQGMLASAILGCLYYIGWLRWEPLPVRWLTRPYHRATVLSSLAQIVERGSSLAPALAILARWYPQPNIRRRLERAEARTAAGEDWCDTLVRQRLLTRSDAGVLRAAQRVGNLPWAMREMSLRHWRHLQTRANLLDHVVLPLLLVVYAVPVGFLVISLFLPIVQLIKELA